VADQPGASGPYLGDLVDLTGEVRDGVRERHGTVRVEDRDDRPVHDRDPVGDLLHIRHGRREADEEDVRRRVDDDLLPHGAAPLVAHVVALVEHDEPEVVEPRAVERVSQYFGRHDEHPAVRVHLHVARENADRLVPVSVTCCGDGLACLDTAGGGRLRWPRERVGRAMLKRLSPAAVEAYHGDGFYFPVRVLSADEARGYRRSLEAVEAAQGGPLRGELRHKGHLVFTWLDALVRHPVILDAVEDMLGPNILCLSSSFFLKDARDPAYVSWHQDATYWG